MASAVPWATISMIAFMAVVLAVNAQAPAPAPTSDGKSIDQGIAYVLMLMALVLTYLIHPFVGPLGPLYKFF